jgi:hypothetical protein
MNHGTPWRPRFVFGTGGDIVDWALGLSMRPWDPETDTVGGTRTAAGGIPAGYVVRTDHNMVLNLRLFESELPTLDRLVAWGQPGESILFYPDRSDDSVFFEVWLESPAAGESWRPRRMRGFQKVFEFAITVRLASAGPWALEYFPDCA